ANGGLPQKDENAGSVCESTRPEPELRLHFTQSRTYDVPFNGEITSHGFHSRPDSDTNTTVRAKRLISELHFPTFATGDRIYLENLQSTTIQVRRRQR